MKPDGGETSRGRLLSSGIDSPSASSTSALPDRLETSDCRASPPAPARSREQRRPVEILKLPGASPPVPTISMRAVRAATAAGAPAAHACAKPRSSRRVTSLARSAAIIAPAIAGGELARRSDASSSSPGLVLRKVRGRSIRRSSAHAARHRSLHRRTPAYRRELQEIPQQCGPSGVRMLSGWNCTPSTVSVRWRTPMISPSAVRALTSSSGGSVSGAAISEW